MEYLLLILGFVLLIKGADAFVEGSSNIAKFFKIPTVIIGLTLVAFGTSAPEAAVSVTAALNNSSDMSISNVIGSNLFNLFVILGFIALFKVVKAEKNVIQKDFIISIFSIIVLLLIMLIYYVFSSNLMLGRIGGLILLFFMGMYLISMLKSVNKEDKVIETKKFEIKDIIYVVLGLSAVILGGQLTVNNATIIAKNFGMSERLIGLTIVAIGTSLPELCTSLVALFKGENDIAVGNVIGSNIFNVLFILGIGSVIRPMMLNIESLIDIMILLVGCIASYFFCFKNFKVRRKEGIGLLLFYIIYSVYIFVR